MSRKCQITGKSALTGHKVSHSNRKSKKRQLPNLQYKKIFVPELNRYVKIKITTRVLRTISKKGLIAVLHENGLTIKDVT